MSDVLKRLGRGSITYGLGDVLQKSVAFLLVPIYTQFLSPSDYGIIAVITAVAGVLSIVLGFGLRGAVERHYHDLVGQPGEVRPYMGTVFLTYMVGGAGLAGLLLMVGPWLSTHVLRQIPFHPFITLTIWTAYVSAGGGILLGLYRAREQSGRYVVLQAVGSILAFVLTVWFIVALGRGVVGRVEASAIASAILFIGYLVLTGREASLRFSFSKAQAALLFGLPLVPHLLAVSVTAIFDRFVLERYVLLTEVGVYALGYQIGMIVGFAAVAVNSAWVPIFYDMARRRPDAPSVVSRLTTLYAAGIVVFGSLVTLFGREIVGFIAPPSYGESVRVVPIVAAAYCFQGLYFMAVTPLFHMKKTHAVPLVSGFAAAVTIVLLFLLIPRFGMIGAAYATLIAFGVQWAATILLAQRWYVIPYDLPRLAGAGALLLTVLVAELYTRSMTGWAAVLANTSVMVALVGALFALGIVPVWRWRGLGEWIGA